MEPLTNMTPEEIQALFLAWGEGPARAKKLGNYLFKDGMKDFSQMKDLRAPLRERLREHFFVPSLTVRDKHTSSDGTMKFVFTLPDGEAIETVMIPDVGVKKGKRALCISTQVGCAMACTFCRTGISGLKRNLATWEIIEQVLEARRHCDGPITHTVFMGMGEPLHNFDNLMRAIQILSSPKGAAFPEEKISVSTSGLAPQFRRLANETKVYLALSFHAPNDSLREEIMPINKRYPIQSVLEVIRELPIKKQSRVFLEYILLEGVNDELSHADELAQTLSGLRCKVNLIPYNETPSLPYKRPSEERIFAFLFRLKSYGFAVSLRRSRGRDIAAACGQLADRKKREALSAAAL